ncbi:MAG: YqaJ viral recombinase family protein [Novosphingobium sp.]|nr:YqaJ viral recombinase family protein [Novosphingobium sp.]
MKIYELDKIVQGSEEWHVLRTGKLTASHAQAIGNCGAGLKSYVNSMMADIFSTGVPDDKYTGEDMERGNELEMQARQVYELMYDVEVKEVGFCEIDDYVGFSPDGLIKTDGLLEIKCPKGEVYMKIVMDGEKAIDSKYIWQVQMELMLSKRKWCDLVFYNPNYKLTTTIFRIYPDEIKFEKLKKGIEEGKKMIKEYIRKYNNLIGK